MEIIQSFIPFAGIALTFGIVYFVVTTRHKERMKLIESGADAKLFYDPRQRRSKAIRFGMLLIGVGVGIFLGNMIGTLTVMKEGIAIPSMILICGGAGLLLGNQIAKKDEDSKDN